VLIVYRFTKGDGNELSRSGGSGSGGYLAYILRYAAAELFGIKVSEEDIQDGTGNIERIPGRNAGTFYSTQQKDSITWILHSDTRDKQLLRFTSCYGFRNIQNIVRRVSSVGSTKKKDTTPDFVEIMACPSGCNNGGGQLKIVGENITSVEQKMLIQECEAVYAGEKVQGPEVNEAVRALLADWFGDGKRDLLHTQYHAVAKLDAQEVFTNW
jgi:iron only hydrogenase large subunit-like protein